MKHIYSFAFLIMICTSSLAQWNSLNSGTASMVTGISFPTTTTGYFVTDIGVVSKTTDGGTTWNNVGPQKSINALYFINASTGF